MFTLSPPLFFFGFLNNVMAIVVNLLRSYFQDIKGYIEIVCILSEEALACHDIAHS